MLNVFIYGMVFLGAALMVYNIYGFVSFARETSNHKAFRQKNGILQIPIFLLIMFLLGYLAVGIFGKPDLIVAGILFGGSIFVFIIYLLLNGITKRIIESDQLEARLIAADESNRVKSSFLAGISHEMRTPMNVILGQTRIALRSTDLTPELRSLFEKINHSCLHLSGLINNILDLNRIESGMLVVHKQPFSMRAAMEQVAAIAQAMCEEKGLTFRFDAGDADGNYVGDALQIKNILLAILDNAVKYTDAPGTVALTVDTASRAGNDRTLSFSVADTGIGIDKEFFPHLFEAFSQEDSSFTNRFGGSGLSLALTKHVAELMGGTIDVRSEKNVGSTFTVTLPLEFDSEESAPQTKADAQPQTDYPPLAGRRVLIVEDLPENAEIVQDLLELEDVETDHAENGQIALDMFRASAPDTYDAILMDLRMPVMDGLEATRRIRALDRPDAKTVPIIALTANAFESDVQNSLAAGMNAHMAKPTDADMLYEMLKRHIAQAKGVKGGEQT